MNEEVSTLFDENEAQHAGRWHRWVGTAKSLWGDLTDDDVLSTKGSIENLLGLIQQRYGDTKAAIRKRIESMLS